MTEEFMTLGEVKLEEMSEMLSNLPLEHLDMRGNKFKESVDYLRSERLAKEREAKRAADLKKLEELKQSIKKAKT